MKKENKNKCRKCGKTKTYNPEIGKYVCYHCGLKKMHVLSDNQWRRKYKGKKQSLVLL